MADYAIFRIKYHPTFCKSYARYQKLMSRYYHTISMKSNENTIQKDIQKIKAKK